VEPSLDEWVIQHGVVLASRHKRVACQVREDRSCAIGTIQTHQGAQRGKLVGFQVSLNGLEPLAQFLAIDPVAFVAETAEPLMAVGLQDGCAGTNHLASLASGVAWSTYGVEATLRRWQRICVR